MSIAGIRSNRGDIYQKLIAFEWALTVLTNPDYLWLETDSTTHSVDDIVIGKSDGSVICCQCKKNQTNFKAWSISDLSDELEKTIQELDANQDAKVRFYSRDSFGDLAKLKEFNISFSNENQYKAKLTNGHVKTDADLENLIEKQGSNLSTFEFLSRTRFEVTYDFDRLNEKLHENLSSIATNSNDVFNAFWGLIDKLGGREIEESLTASTQHRLTKEDLKNTLHKSGAILAPPMSMNEARQSFLRTSAIGRSWTRDIAGQKISNPVLDKLLNAIKDGKKAILLSGGPGSGKTCVMLELQEKLEQRAQKKADITPLFIQSREFADLSTVNERQSLGLSEQSARLAEEKKVVVVSDS